MNYKLMDLYVYGDRRGSLVSLEEQRDVPFDIKRVYYIYGTKPGVERGKHAHIHLKQIVVCVSGSCTFILDDGKNQKEIELNRPDVGLYIGENIWREIKNFSRDCVVMVLASEYYDENEYIRNYEKFKKEVKCLAI